MSESFTKQVGTPVLKVLRNKADIFILSLIIFFLGINVLWFSLDTRPPMWDQASYLWESIQLSHALEDGGIVALLRTLHTTIRQRAPLISLLPAPFYLLFGNSETVAMIALNLICIPLLLISVYRIGELLAEARCGAIAACILATMPLVFGLSRHFLVETPLTAFLTVGFLFLLKSQRLSLLKWNIAFGVTAALGLLVKVTYPVYVFGPLCLVVIKRLKYSNHDAFQRRFITDIISVLIPVILIAGPWYLINTPHWIQFAIQRSFWFSGYFVPIPLLSFWKTFADVGISPYYALLLIVSIILWILRSQRMPRQWSMELIIWFILPALIFSVGKNRDIRYLLPALPALSLILACNFPFNKGRLAVLALLALPLANLVYVSFYSGPSIPAKGFALLGTYSGYSSSARRENWKTLEVIARVRQQLSGSRSNVLVVSLHPYFEVNVFNYESLRQGHPIQFSLLKPEVIVEGPSERVINHAKEFDYIMYKTGDQGPEIPNRFNRALFEALENEMLPFVEVNIGVTLPDGSTVKMFKKSIPQSN